MTHPNTAIIHYSAPPVIGGVEAVIQAHVAVMVRLNYPVTVVAGRGEIDALPEPADLDLLPFVDSQRPEILEVSKALDEGDVPPNFDKLTRQIQHELAPVLQPFDNVIIHNIFTKHFNLPLTAALHHLLDEGTIRHAIAWCHDFTWTSPSSGHKVFPSYPWDLLRTYREDVTYVVVSEQRRQTLADLFACPPEEIHVIYNGVDPQMLLGLTAEGHALIRRLDLLNGDLILLMPVRVTHAKNIEYALQVLAALKSHLELPKLILTGPPDPHDDASMAYFHELQALRDDLGLSAEMHFVFESGPDPDEPYTVGMDVVGDLFRVSDLMFMPSHREGFGMPVLEAGLVGMPVVSTDVPAAQEIGGEDVIGFDAEAPPEEVAERIAAWAEESCVHRMRRRVRQNYTWMALFQDQIAPLLHLEVDDA